MDQHTGDFAPQKGMRIVGSDGEPVGEIDLVEQTYVIVRKGGIFPQDHFIAIKDISGQDEDGTLRLAIPAEEALERGLGNPMAALGGEGETTTTDLTAMEATAHDDRDTRDPTAEAGTIEHDLDVAEVDTTADPGVSPAPVDVAEMPEPEPLEAAADDELDIAPDTEAIPDDMHRTVTLSAEEVTATTRPVERGVVHVEKKVVEEKVTLEVPLVEDEVHVTRRAVNREIGDADAPFEERTIEVPLRGQGVEIEKRAHVVEEVEIGKTAHQHVETITETVRHETARIETEGVEIDADDEPVDA